MKKILKKIWPFKKRLYICPMRKAIIILACFMGVGLHSQIKAENKISYQSKFKKSDGVYFYRPIKCIKLSMKPTLDDGQIYDLLTDTNSDFNTDDYLSVGKIDMRMKVYLFPRVSFIMGGQFSGITGYNYMSGIIIKLN